jgi:hypothetical protein
MPGQGRIWTSRWRWAAAVDDAAKLSQQWQRAVVPDATELWFEIQRADRSVLLESVGADRCGVGEVKAITVADRAWRIANDLLRTAPPQQDRSK